MRQIAHDPAAFEAFYREHVEAVERFVARRVSDPHLAADLTAEAFVAAIDAAASYRAIRGEPRAWLFGIARNVVASEFRRAERERRAHARGGCWTPMTSPGCRSASTRPHGLASSTRPSLRSRRASARRSSSPRWTS
jgi:RNA polymerase sigma factor (sigma-70 family)